MAQLELTNLLNKESMQLNRVNGYGIYRFKESKEASELSFRIKLLRFKNGIKSSVKYIFTKYDIGSCAITKFCHVGTNPGLTSKSIKIHLEPKLPTT